MNKPFNQPALLEDHLTVIYAIAPTPEGPTKIGLTGNIQARLASLQTGSWMPLTAYGCRVVIMRGQQDMYRSFPEAARRGAQKLERDIHRVLSEMELNLTGEWFDVTPAEALQVIAKCGERIGARAVDLESAASVSVDPGLDRDLAAAQRRIVKQLATINLFLMKFQPNKIDIRA